MCQIHHFISDYRVISKICKNVWKISSNNLLRLLVLCCCGLNRNDPSKAHRFEYLVPNGGAVLEGSVSLRKALEFQELNSFHLVLPLPPAVDQDVSSQLPYLPTCLPAAMLFVVMVLDLRSETVMHKLLW